MQPARYKLALVVAIALLAGLFYSQVCDLNCTFYGCRLPTTSEAKQGDQAGHCHEQQPKPAPPEPDNSPDCPAHSELSALISTTTISVGAFNLSLPATTLPSSVYTAIQSTDVMLVGPDQIPFRAPPAHSILRI